MALDKKHIDLLKKLAEGSISEKEKWTLERASLDDPFLAEALEGYYDNVHDDTKKIHAHVSSQKPNRKVFLRSLSVAATLLILLAASFWVFNGQFETSNSSSKLESIAEIEDELKTNKREEPAVRTQTPNPTVDGVRIENNIDESMYKVETEGEAADKIIVKANDSNPRGFQNAPPKENKSVPVKERLRGAEKRKVSKAKKTKATVAKDIVPPPAAPAQETEEEADVFMDVADDSEFANVDGVAAVPSLQTQIIKGQVLDTEGNPLIGVNIKSEQSEKNALTDVDGTFEIPVEGDNEILSVSYTGYRGRSIIAQPNVSIELEEAQNMLSEVVVVGSNLMSEAERGKYYSDKLDAFFKSKPAICLAFKNEMQSRSVLGRQEKVDINILINQSGMVQKLDFLNLNKDDCKIEIENLLYNAAKEGLFDSSNATNFKYTLSLK